MDVQFRQIEWDAQLEDDCRQLIRLAIREDLAAGCDWTTVALIAEPDRGAARIVARETGIVTGLGVVPLVLDEAQADLQWEPEAHDRQSVSRGNSLGRLSGSARDLLTLERIVLNFIGRLSGIATLTASYVAQLDGTRARLLDTRKTTPGWRRLEKYAVRCGGGWNHRSGLDAAILIKDNHLAMGRNRFTSAQAVEHARQFLAQLPDLPETMVVEIEVDTLEQLEAVLPQRPDVVLLDNMSLDELREAVRLRDQLTTGVALEASGGVNLKTLRAIAETGVDYVSVGALTHSSAHLDVGLDWET